MNENAAYIHEKIMAAGTIGLIGHVRPDGDAVGSCLGLKGYINTINPAAKVTVFLGEFSKDFDFLEGADEVCSDFSQEMELDLCFMLDCSDIKRMGDAAKYFLGAKEQICLDHHATGDDSYHGFIVKQADISSTSELVCTLIDMDKLSQGAAEALYLGIVHDTGVFKYDCTKRQTMEIAGKLLELGARSAYVIDETFYKKGFNQNRALGQVLLDAKLELGGRFIWSRFSCEQMKQFGISSLELDGFVNQLLLTEGAEIAAFMYELSEGSYKVSLRAKNFADVSVIAAKLGGGGHVKAAAFEMKEDGQKIIELIMDEAAKQLH